MLGHPAVEIAALTGESKAGQPIDAVYPHLAGFGLPDDAVGATLHAGYVFVRALPEAFWLEVRSPAPWD